MIPFVDMIQNPDAPLFPGRPSTKGSLTMLTDSDARDLHGFSRQGSRRRRRRGSRRPRSRAAAGDGAAGTAGGYSTGYSTGQDDRATTAGPTPRGLDDGGGAAVGDAVGESDEESGRGVAVTLDVESAGEFLVMAATLVEIKAKSLTPREEGADGSDAAEALAGLDRADPRLDLVRQLLAYQRFRDASEALDSLRQEHARRHEVRVGVDEPAAEAATEEAEPELEL
jgi:hypothetical protein